MAEEPPYLQVGTEVSAKYKGAFCEAKIKAVKILVKCRVNFSKGNLATINNDMIKGSLKPGSKVEAKHSDGGYHSATIIRVTDASVYTVVFDDGDECTLRRSSLCLKGARHFKESQTLDQLPLTDPENFGNPVMLSGKRRRRHVSESSDDESEETFQPKKINIAKDYPIGAVMFLENERRKSSWLPVVIVPTKFMIEECSPSSNTICVRSFRDGRFYTAEPSELHEFATDKEPLLSILNGDIHHTHKQAIDKAMTYMNTQELPWDIDLPQKKQQKKQQQQQQVPEVMSPPTVKPEEMAEQNHEEREKFLTVLKQFHLDRGTPMTRPPVLSQKTLDLYRLYHLVQEYGGMEKVTQDMKWKHLYNQLGLSSQITSASYSLKMAYKKHLYPFEEHQKTVEMEKKKEEEEEEEETEMAEEEDGGMSPAVKANNQQSGDEESGSVTSSKSSNMDQNDQESDQGTGPPDHSETTDDITMESTDNNNEDEKYSAPSTYTVGEKIKVSYGKGKFLKNYVAKIMDSTMESGMREYYVHYSGWNARYDEWIPEDRIATRLAAGSNERTRPSTAKKKQSPKNRRGRPPLSVSSPTTDQSNLPNSIQQSKASRQQQQQQKTTPAAGGSVAARESLAKPGGVPVGPEGNKPSPTPTGRGPGRPKKKRPSAPLPAPVLHDTTTATSTIAAPLPILPSPPAVTTKRTDGDMDQATPPLPHNNKVTDTAMVAVDSTVDSNTTCCPVTNSDHTQAVSNHEQVSDSSDATERATLTQDALETVKKEVADETNLPLSPARPVTPPLASPKQRTPSPVELTPCPEVVPPPVLASPNKGEAQELHEDVVTPPASVKRKKATPDGKKTPDVKKKAKASLQERRREQASDWIVDFSKMPELDSAGRIAILTEKIGAIQKRYAELKAEVAYIDRKKRRAKQREREAIRNNQSPVVECQ